MWLILAPETYEGTWIGVMERGALNWPLHNYWWLFDKNWYIPVGMV